MTINEFKAWLEGFSEGMSAAPTPAQWDAIKAKLATVRESVQPAALPTVLREWTPDVWTYPDPVTSAWRYPNAGRGATGGSASTAAQGHIRAWNVSASGDVDRIDA